MRHSNGHLLFLNDVIQFDIVRHGRDFRTAGIAAAGFDIESLFFDDFHQPELIREDFFQIGNAFPQLPVFLDQLVAFETGQTLQTHIEDRLSLTLGKTEALTETFLRNSRVFASADDPNDFINMIQRF